MTMYVLLVWICTVASCEQRPEIGPWDSRAACERAMVVLARLPNRVVRCDVIHD